MKSTHSFKRLAVLVVVTLACRGQSVLATDYFLTIGGGYNPTGNQASLEANVVFFQDVLTQKHPGAKQHEVFFADGHDPAADLQVLAARNAGQADLPATSLLVALHRRREPDHVEYRDHRVPHVSGSLDPKLIRASLEQIARNARPGDRLFVYVTAHGSAAEKGGFNTTIDCWNQKKITAREFAGWLSDIPSDVPVVMVMAQCYCGGFARTIYDGLDEKKGLAMQLRAGFFAQRHDLPAAGCRPDIDNDDEFSSYFWGAIAGRSRTGVPIHECDINRDGRVSFAEAYAYAVWAGNTIDIPLRTSDVMLRTYSRIGSRPGPSASEPKPDAADAAADSTEIPPTEQTAPDVKLAAMEGALDDLLRDCRPVSRHIVAELLKNLGLTPLDSVQSVEAAYNAHRRRPPQGQRRRSGSGRRELLAEIAEKWPELADPAKWEKSELLQTDNQEKLVDEIKQLPSWKTYDSRRQQTKQSSDKAEEHELREVKYRRLIHTLESIVLEKNLPAIATPEIIERYGKLMALEESAF